MSNARQSLVFGAYTNCRTHVGPRSLVLSNHTSPEKMPKVQSHLISQLHDMKIKNLWWSQSFKQQLLFLVMELPPIIKEVKNQTAHTLSWIVFKSSAPVQCGSSMRNLRSPVISLKSTPRIVWASTPPPGKLYRLWDYITTLVCYVNIYAFTLQAQEPISSSITHT